MTAKKATPTTPLVKAAVEPSTILSEFDVLARRTAEINELLSQLEERLSPILYFPPPSEPCAGTDDNGPALRIAVRFAQANADNIAARIRFLMDRIDL